MGNKLKLKEALEMEGRGYTPVIKGILEKGQKNNDIRVTLGETALNETDTKNDNLIWRMMLNLSGIHRFKKKKKNTYAKILQMWKK